MKSNKPLFFGPINIKKNCVSFHLTPVYVEPALIVDVSVALKKRMQGKSCLNFKRLELFSELTLLTAAGRQSYQQQKYI